MESPRKGCTDTFTFRFPARLWRIINSCSSGAISWGPNGKTIRILRKKFEEEYLSGDGKPFKTTKYESFVRQLNHYGFKKVKKRNAVKKITTSSMRGESKEETALLSEYHNPNFTRGQPERVTFLERRNQMHSIPGQRRRTKRSIASATVQNHDCMETTTSTKIKKDTSVQVSQSLLLPGDQDCLSSSDDKCSTTTRLSGKQQKTRGVPIQTSLAELGDPTRHNIPLNQPMVVQRGMSSMFQQPVSERWAVRAEERLLHQHRPYYNHDGLDPHYIRPSLVPQFSHHTSQAWRQPFHPCHPTQMYEHVTAYGRRVEPMHLPFPSDYRHLSRVQSPDTEQYPPLYPDNRYFPLRPVDAWNSMYKMNGRHRILMTKDFDQEYKGRNNAGKCMIWPQEYPVNSYERDPLSHHDMNMAGPDPYSSWSRHRFNGMESMSGVQWISPNFVAPHTATVPTINNDTRSLVVAKGYDSARDFHKSFGQSMTKQVSTCTYGQTSTIKEPTGTSQTSVKQAEEPDMLVAFQQVRRDGSNGSGFCQEQTELTVTVTKNEGDDQDFSENLHIITDDAVDLPLDVAEETVVTCNANSVAASDHCLPLAQISSTEEMLMDTLLNATVVSPANTLELFSLPTEKPASVSRQTFCQGNGTYASGQSDVTQSQNFSQKFANHFNASQKSSTAHTAVPEWTYSDFGQQNALSGQCNMQEQFPHSWSLPVSNLEEETVKGDYGTNKYCHKPFSFSKNGVAELENSLHQGNNVRTLNNPAINSMEYGQSSHQANSYHQEARAFVEREENGDLSQLSSSSVQDLLSATLKTQGMKIMVNDDCHTDKTLLVIPKGNRREVNGYV